MPSGDLNKQNGISELQLLPHLRSKNVSVFSNMEVRKNGVMWQAVASEEIPPNKCVGYNEQNGLVVASCNGTPAMGVCRLGASINSTAIVENCTIIDNNNNIEVGSDIFLADNGQMLASPLEEILFIQKIGYCVSEEKLLFAAQSPLILE